MISRLMLVLIMLPVALPATGSSDAPAKTMAQPADDTARDSIPEAADVLVTVNGESLYSEDVASVLGAIHEAATPDERADFDIDHMLFRLVNDTLIAQEARALGMDELDSIREKVAAQSERLAVRRLEWEEIYSRIDVDQKELEAEYEEIFQTVTVRIVTRREEDEAREIFEKIRAGADLETLAREQSQDPYSMRGGLMNNVPRLDLAASFAKVVFGMKPGDLGGPVQTSHGWTVFRVESFTNADPELRERRMGEVRDVLRFEKRDKLRADLLARLRGTHEVTFYQEVFDDVGVETMPDGRLLPKIVDPAAVVVDAGGRAITAAQFGQALSARWGSIAMPDVALRIKPILLDSLVVDELIVAEALRRGYHQTPEVEREAHALEARLLVGQYLKDVVAPQAEPTSQEVEEYFEANRDQFRRPPKLYVSQLTVESLEKAEQMAELIRSGTEISWLARQHSQDRFRGAGGVVGWVPANEGIRGFTKELATASAGDLFGPKGAGDTWQIVSVGAVEEQGHYTLDEVSGNVRSRLESENFIRLVDAFINLMRERSEIVVNDEALAKLRVDAALEMEGDAPASPGHGG